jgi:hypothetical protein
MPQTNQIPIKNSRRTHQTLKMSQTCLSHLSNKILKNCLINLLTQIRNHHNPILTNQLAIRKKLSLPTIQPDNRHNANRAQDLLLKIHHPLFNSNLSHHYCLKINQQFHHYHLPMNLYLQPYLQMMLCKIIQTNPQPLLSLNLPPTHLTPHSLP